MTEVSTLCDRLRRKEGGWLTSDGAPDAEGFVAMKEMEPRLANPDGPAAAARIEKLEAALHQIAGGFIPGGSTMVVEGRWRDAYAALQTVAKEALGA